MYIDAATIITSASVLTAIGLIIGFLFKWFKWYERQNKQDSEITQIKDEQCLICYGLLSCLDGLKQLGANGNVTTAHDKLEKHINQSAHK